MDSFWETPFSFLNLPFMIREKCFSAQKHRSALRQKRVEVTGLRLSPLPPAKLDRSGAMAQVAPKG